MEDFENLVQQHVSDLGELLDKHRDLDAQMILREAYVRARIHGDDLNVDKNTPDSESAHTYGLDLHAQSLSRGVYNKVSRYSAVIEGVLFFPTQGTQAIVTQKATVELLEHEHAYRQNMFYQQEIFDTFSWLTDQMANIHPLIASAKDEQTKDTFIRYQWEVTYKMLRQLRQRDTHPLRDMVERIADSLQKVFPDRDTRLMIYDLDSHINSLFGDEDIKPLNWRNYEVSPAMLQNIMPLLAYRKGLIYDPGAVNKLFKGRYT